LRHRRGEILARPGPTRGIDARRALERVDRKTGIIGERRQLRGFRRGDGLDARIGLEGFAGLLRFVEVEFACRISTSLPGL